MSVSAIWAQARDTSGRPVIGAGDTIPWHVPEDFARFKRLTSGHPVVMGMRTWLSLPRRPLPGRTNIVLSDTPGWSDDGAVVATSLDQGLTLASQSPGGEQVWVIGGGQVYGEAIGRGLADVVEVTEIDTVVDGDTFAPVLDAASWLPVGGPHTPWATSTGPQALRHRFVTYARR